LNRAISSHYDEISLRESIESGDSQPNHPH